MQGVNQVTIIGNIGSDPEFKQGNSSDILKFRVAVGTKWGDREHTEWFNVVIFGKLAEVLSSHVEKGKPVFVSGRLETREYEDNDGAKKRWTDLIAETVRLLGERRGDRDGGGGGDRRGNDDRGANRGRSRDDSSHRDGYGDEGRKSGGRSEGNPYGGGGNQRRGFGGR